VDGGFVSNDQAEEVSVADKLLTDIKVTIGGGADSGLCRGLFVNGRNINLTIHQGQIQIYTCTVVLGLSKAVS